MDHPKGDVCLVTGATGFIGGQLTRRLIEEGNRVRCLVRSTSDTTSLEELGVELVVGNLASTGGGTVSLASLAGKSLVINFWRSDCPPCRAELPLLQQRVGAQSGARLVLINWGESADLARSFLVRNGIQGDALLDVDLTTGRSYGIAALPTTIFVRADGTIDRRQVGQIDERVLASELSRLITQ